MTNESIKEITPSLCKEDIHGVLFTILENNENPFLKMYYGCQRNWGLHYIEPPGYILNPRFSYFALELTDIQIVPDITALFRQFKEISESKFRIILFDKDSFIEFNDNAIKRNKPRFYYYKEEVPLDSLWTEFAW